MKIINLVEDTKDNECLNEHGLSFYIETQNHALIMDSGATDMFLHNATILGVDVSAADTFILSHGHYDHSGGLISFTKMNNHADIYIRDNADDDYYHVSVGEERYIGIDKNIMNLPQVKKVSKNTKIDEELFLFTGINGTKYPSWSNCELKRKVGDTFVQDDFSHEMCLVVREKNSNILLSGCAHNGVLSVLERYYELFGEYPDIVISGFHMMKKTAYTDEETDYIIQTATELMKTKSIFYTGHCTGQKAFDIMKKEMGDQLHIFHSGSKILM